MALKLYPLGIQTFERIRKENKLYIDKTEYVYRLTHTSGTKHKIKNAFILFIPYHQTLFILSFYTQKCNS